jgi:tetratricopeptide (TPR) repeat protein
MPSHSVPTLSQNAAAQWKTGQFDAARKKLYERILRIEPKNHDALNALGLLVAAQGDAERGIRLIRRAIAFHPRSSAALNNLALVLLNSHRSDEALASLDKATALNPQNVEALVNRGNALINLSQVEEALISYDMAIALRPQYAEAFYNRGNALRRLDRLEEALASYDEAIALHPEFADAFNNRGVVLRDVSRYEEAVASYDKAITLRPKFADAFNNRGEVLSCLYRYEEALASLDKAVALRPEHAEAFRNRGKVLAQLGRRAEAIAQFQKAFTIDSTFFSARVSEAQVHLAVGEMDVGWRIYEDRWRLPGASEFAQSQQPSWRGNEDLRDKTIRLYAEQGLGDTLQFARYAPLVAARGARVLLEVQAPLVRLLKGMPGIDGIFKRGDALPPHDYSCPLLSLPFAFGTRVETIPGEVPYLRSDPVLTAAWRERLAGLAGPRVGLAWAGNPKNTDFDRRRSITLKHFRYLAELPEISLVSLQKGEAAAQTEAPPPGLMIHDWTSELRDFADTAALVEGLDLVISVDTAVAHLAGALGKPVWLLNRFDSCWRWLIGRDDSPWYPTLRQFRQSEPGNWDGVMTDLKAALARFVRQDMHN